MDYYGHNDFRDYHLAHYGKKGMKWKKGRQTPIVPITVGATSKRVGDGPYMTDEEIAAEAQAIKKQEAARAEKKGARREAARKALLKKMGAKTSSAKKTVSKNTKAISKTLKRLGATSKTTKQLPRSSSIKKINGE